MMLENNNTNTSRYLLDPLCIKQKQILLVFPIFECGAAANYINEDAPLYSNPL